MKTIKFKVDGQDLRRVQDSGDYTGIVKGSKGYLQCEFDLSNEWSTYQAAAIFQYKDITRMVTITDGLCNVPDDVTDGECFIIKLLGVKSADQYFYTRKVLIEQED